MDNPYLSMLSEVVAEAMPALPYFIAIVAFIFALKVLEAKFSPKKRRRWRGSSN